MFERIVDVLSGFWADLKLFETVEPYEGGVHIRWGKFYRVLNPGIRFKLPIIDGFITTNTAITTMNLPTQTVGNMIVGAIVRYEIADPKAYLLSIWDADDVLSDVTMGAIRETVEKLPDAPKAEKKVLAKAKRELTQYGFKIHAVTFTDFGKIRSIRLISE